jgi:hypothetical protein
MLVGGTLRADVFRLRHGGRIEGEWLNRDTPNVEHYEIGLAHGGRVTVAADLVAEVVAPADGSREAAGAAPETGPENEFLERLGYVRYKGDWRLAQEVELDSRGERQVNEERDWRKRLRVWRTAIVRGRNDAAAALTQLRALDSPFAITPLAELLAEPEEPPQLKVVYIEVLSKFRHGAAVTALLERAMKDPELEVRERSADALKVVGPDQALAILTRLLKDKDNQVVNQAGWVLGRLGEPAAIPALIDAVVTKHRFQVKTGSGPGGISGGFSPQGGGGLQAGGGVKIIEQELQNRQVLTALTTLTPAGVNFGFDQVAWKNWYAQQQLPRQGNLRRDQ